MMSSNLEGLPWFGMVETKRNTQGEEKETFVSLLPPMSLFPPEKRPDPGEIADPEGDMAVFDSKNKRWLRIKGGASKIYATVFRAIEYSDPTATTDSRNYGKILIDGQEPPMTKPDDPEADPEIDIDKLTDCCCLGLGKDPDGENHQQLYKGQRIEVGGPFKRKNPDYVDPETLPEGEEPPEDNPEYKDYCEAEPVRLYSAKADADIEHPENGPTQNGTITLKDSEENEVTMFVSGARIPSGQKIFGGENASAYDIELRDGSDGWALYFMHGDCPTDIPSVEP